MPDNMQHKRVIIATAPNYTDFLDFLVELQNTLADVRNPAQFKNDSIDLRKNLSDVIQGEIDSIKRIRDNATIRATNRETNNFEEY